MTVSDAVEELGRLKERREVLSYLVAHVEELFTRNGDSPPKKALVVTDHGRMVGPEAYEEVLKALCEEIAIIDKSVSALEASAVKVAKE